MTGVDLTRTFRGGGLHGMPKVISEVGTDHVHLAFCQALRFLVGANPQQHHHRLLKFIDAQRPRPAPTVRRLRCVWRPTRCTAPTVPWAHSCAGSKPTWERPRPSLPRPTSWPGSSTPCCATDTGTWTPERSTMSIIIAKGHCTPPCAGRLTTGLPVGAHDTEVHTLDTL